tara:strand:+ start:153 stop:569 length:417 start_codon:yes stop_codon:yes gene_type:complete
MPEFTSERSQRVLSELSPPLRSVCTAAIKHIDFSLIDGARTTEQQQALFAEGKSTLDGVNSISKHQTIPERPKSEAFDFIPAPFTTWEDRPLFTAYAYFFIGLAYDRGIELISGLDWDGDFRWRDQRFVDMPHIERVL